MTYFFLESSKMSSLIVFSTFLSVIILLLSYLLSVSAPDIEKLSSYECGFDPYVNAKSVLNLRCYLVAILLLVFDLEAVLFYPWCVSLSFLNLDVFWSVTDFILDLLFGFFSVCKVGLLSCSKFVCFFSIICFFSIVKKNAKRTSFIINPVDFLNFFYSILI